MNARLDTFRELHRDGLLLLANAWDAGTARLIESLGASAIATTSAGLAWAHGYADGDHLPVDRLMSAVADIARVVRVPLSIDIEGGYSDEPGRVADTVLGLADLGVVGINLEDGRGTPDLLCAKIQRIKHDCARRGLDVFINARTDIYLRGLAPEAERVEATLARAARYRDAGADGLFVPGLRAVDEIAAVASGAGLPLNILLRPNLPDPAALRSLGVRRLSAGSDIAQAAFAQIASLAGAFLQSGTLDAATMDYSRINTLLDA